MPSKWICMKWKVGDGKSYLMVCLFEKTNIWYSYTISFRHPMTAKNVNQGGMIIVIHGSCKKSVVSICQQSKEGNDNEIHTMNFNVQYKSIKASTLTNASLVLLHGFMWLFIIYTIFDMVWSCSCFHDPQFLFLLNVSHIVFNNSSLQRSDLYPSLSRLTTRKSIDVGLLTLRELLLKTVTTIFGIMTIVAYLVYGNQILHVA